MANSAKDKAEAAYMRLWRKEHPGSGRASHALWARRHPDRIREMHKRSRAKVKAEAIRVYGGRCYCCRERRLPFLTLGHPNGGGRAHRESLGGSGSFYSGLRRLGYPPGQRVECWNCNCAAAFNGGVCPHENYRT